MGEMPLTRAAQRWCERMAEFFPHEIDDWKRKAAIIAKSQGKTQIGKLDMDSAMMVAGDEFLPCVEDSQT